MKPLGTKKSEFSNPLREFGKNKAQHALKGNLELHDNIVSSSNKGNTEYFKICLTGGPCAGKTTAMADLTNKMTEYGYHVLMAPEVATLSMVAGGDIIVGLMPWDKAIKRQTMIIKMQMKLENYFVELAHCFDDDRPSVILCDRGCRDGKAYVDDELWQAMSGTFFATKVFFNKKR